MICACITLEILLRCPKRQSMQASAVYMTYLSPVGLLQMIRNRRQGRLKHSVTSDIASLLKQLASGHPTAKEGEVILQARSSSVPSGGRMRMLALICD